MSCFARRIASLAGIAAFTAAVPAFAQQKAPLVVRTDQTLTIHADNADRRALITEFARVTGVHIVAGLERVPGRITVQVEGEPLMPAIAKVLSDLDYVVTESQGGDGSAATLSIWIRGHSGEAAVVAPEPEPDADADADDGEAEEDQEADQEEEVADDPEPDEDEAPKPVDKAHPGSQVGSTAPGKPTAVIPKKGSR
jgi:hypothetical protein